VKARSCEETSLNLEADPKLIVNLTRGDVVCERTAIADRARSRMRGLLGRGSLPSGEGMLLQPAPSIHTAFMQFSIDVVFLDGTLGILKIVERMRPWRVASKRHAWAVLELAAGEVARRHIEIGDQLGVVEITDTLGAVEPGLGLSGGDWASFAHRATGRPPRHDSADEVVGGATDAPTNGAPKVLVVGTDRRFRSVAAALLTGRGIAVTLREQMTDVAELAQREGAEVVILDAGTSLTAAAYEAAQIEKLNPRVGVVVVGDEPEERLSAMPVLAKWGSFDGLFNAVEESRRKGENGIALHSG
jgi:uncharacterized membrane protein (UPF0127 family)/CheY-like chemotaxis protein